METLVTIPSLKLTAKAPENRVSQKEIHLATIYFQVRTVSFREGSGLLGGGFSNHFFGIFTPIL